MIVILRPDHSIVYFSPFAEQLTGYSAEEVKGRDYLTLLLPDADRGAVADEFARVIAGRPNRGLENTVICRDGSRRWIVWNARYLPDYEDGPAILSVGHDITFLKQAQERALQSERLAAIGQMVTGSGAREPQRPAALPGVSRDARLARSATAPRRST